MPSASSAPTLPFLERLLDGEKVEWKTLGEVAEIGTGSSNRQDETENGSYPFYVRSKNVLRSSNYQFDETAIIIPGEGGIGDIFHYAEGKYALHQRAYRIKVNTGNELVPKFLFYYMTNAFKPFILARCVGATATSIRKPMLAVFPIPIPPLRVQSRIVEILDKFTQLEAELEAELEARNKQYDFYRNRLLDFAHRDDLAGQVEWKTLGEICENLDSQRRPITSSKRKKGIYPYYGASGIVDFVENYIYEGDYLLVSEDGANLLARNTPIAFSISGKNWVNNHAHVLKFDTYEGRKFVEYYLNQIDLKPYISGAAQPKLNQNNLNSIPIPLPPLSEQRRIVEILDRFDTLTNSISEGLPREIALRRKQYEYYRDALLRFPQPTPTA